MHNNFDIQWQLRCRALTDSHNPLSDDRWQTMVAQACSRENGKRRTESGERRTESGKQKASNKRIWWTAAAAVCLVFAVVGVYRMQTTERPTNVSYSGQSVRFICNNQCNAQSTIAYFDSYIGKKETL